ncbi:MAG: hypothetical protein QM811_01650 [Pirellulales bacterium]
MSASGVGLFQDDVAVDVRNEYVDLIANGVSDEDAHRAILKSWKSAFKDSDEGPIVWLALAATQYAYGRLQAESKRQALAIISRGQGLDRWTDAGLAKKRKAVLEQLKKKLSSPEPNKRTPRKRKTPDIQSIAATAPDGRASATAWQYDTDPQNPKSQVYVTLTVNVRTTGGGSVFSANCAVDRLKLKWLDNDTLRITYPKTANADQHDATCFYSGRTIAVKYRRVST